VFLNETLKDWFSLKHICSILYPKYPSELGVLKVKLHKMTDPT